MKNNIIPFPVINDKHKHPVKELWSKSLCLIGIHKYEYRESPTPYPENVSYNRWIRQCKRCGKMEIEFFFPLVKSGFHIWMTYKDNHCFYKGYDCGNIGKQ